MSFKHYKFPWKISPIDKKMNDQIRRDFTGQQTNFVQIGPEKLFYPIRYSDNAEAYYNIKARPDDVWVVTYPRSGTTLTQELVWLVANGLDYEAAAKKTLDDRFMFLEFSILLNPVIQEDLLKEKNHNEQLGQIIEQISKPSFEFYDELPSPRFIKTHLHCSLMPPSVFESGCKVIYVARNPLDVAVSYYHHYKLFKTGGFNKGFDEYWPYFEDGYLTFGPYWPHVLEGWQRKNDPNFLFLFYEDLNKNMPAEIEKVAKFLGKPLTSDKIAQLASHLKFDNFKNNKSVNKDELYDLGIFKSDVPTFIRSGKTGGWEDEFTPDLKRRAVAWVRKNLEKTDLRFPFVKF